MEEIKKVSFSQIYNNNFIVFNIHNGTSTIKHIGIHLVCIDWGYGYPMPGIKLGNAKITPYKFSDIKDGFGLYTENEFIKLWEKGQIKVYDETGIQLVK